MWGAGKAASVLVNQERVNGREAGDGPNLHYDRTSNLLLEDITELCRKGIKVDDNKNPVPESVNQTNSTSSESIAAFIWKLEGTICTRKTINLQNYSVDFTNYALKDVPNIPRLDLFLLVTI